MRIERDKYVHDLELRMGMGKGMTINPAINLPRK